MFGHSWIQIILWILPGYVCITFPALSSLYDASQMFYWVYLTVFSGRVNLDNLTSSLWCVFLKGYFLTTMWGPEREAKQSPLQSVRTVIAGVKVVRRDFWLRQVQKNASVTAYPRGYLNDDFWTVKVVDQGCRLLHATGWKINSLWCAQDDLNINCLPYQVWLTSCLYVPGCYLPGEKWWMKESVLFHHVKSSEL